MQVAILYYRQLELPDGPPHWGGDPRDADSDIDPISNPWGMEFLAPQPRHWINFEAECQSVQQDELYRAEWPVDDDEKLPDIPIVDMPCQWPVLRQAQVGRAIFTLVDDGSW